MAGLFGFTEEYEGEELDRPSQGRRRKKMPVWIAAVFAVLLSVGILLIGMYLLQIQRIEIRGNRYCNDEIVLSKVFRTEDDYRLSSVISKMIFGVENDGAFKSIRVSLTGLQSAAVTVTETEGIAQVRFSEDYVFLNENGIVIGNLPVQDPEMLLLNGTFFTSYTDFMFPETEDPSLLKDALAVAGGVRKAGLRPLEIRCAEKKYVLVLGDVEVSIGTSENLEAKLREIGYQMPKYEGLKGILHMEDYDGRTEKPYFYFEVKN